MFLVVSVTAVASFLFSFLSSWSSDFRDWSMGTCMAPLISYLTPKLFTAYLALAGLTLSIFFMAKRWNWFQLFVRCKMVEPSPQCDPRNSNCEENTCNVDNCYVKKTRG